MLCWWGAVRGGPIALCRWARRPGWPSERGGAFLLLLDAVVHLMLKLPSLKFSQKMFSITLVVVSFCTYNPCGSGWQAIASVMCWVEAWCAYRRSHRGDQAPRVTGCNEPWIKSVQLSPTQNSGLEEAEPQASDIGILTLPGPYIAPI